MFCQRCSWAIACSEDEYKHLKSGYVAQKYGVPVPRSEKSDSDVFALHRNGTDMVSLCNSTTESWQIGVCVCAGKSRCKRSMFPNWMRQDDQHSLRAHDLVHAIIGVLTTVFSISISRKFADFQAKELFVYWEKEIDCDKAVQTLPRTLTLIIFFALMLLSHEARAASLVTFVVTTGLISAHLSGDISIISSGNERKRMETDSLVAFG
eukprot:Skav201191  [mRNA]  locus=scaffold633:263159:264067:- [translate_table: standard]